MDKADFTPADGIAIQQTQLTHWQSVLKPEVFEKLKAWATASNHLAKTGYDICRGTDLNFFVVHTSQGNEVEPYKG